MARFLRRWKKSQISSKSGDLFLDGWGDIFGLLIQNASPEKIIAKTSKCQQIKIRVAKIATFGFIAALGIGLLIFIWKCVVSTQTES